MAIQALVGRLTRLEVRVGEAALTWLSTSRAGEHDGVSSAELRAELQTLSRQIALRLGPNPGRRELAALVAERYGGDADAIYANMTARREDR